jgi:hypothetical protein
VEKGWVDPCRTLPEPCSLCISAGEAGSKDRQENAMLTHPYITRELAREHQHQLLATAHTRRLQHQLSSPRNASAARTVIRHITTALRGIATTTRTSSTPARQATAR